MRDDTRANVHTEANLEMTCPAAGSSFFLFSVLFWICFTGKFLGYICLAYVLTPYLIFALYVSAFRFQVANYYQIIEVNRGFFL